MKDTRHSILMLAIMLTAAFTNQTLQGQISRGGVPVSVRQALLPDNSPAILISAPDLAPIRAEDERNPLPYRFAVNIPTMVDIDGSGSWSQLSDGSRIWRATVTAPGALGLTLYFDRFAIPEGGRLFIYNPARTRILGAFTSANNHPSGTFATSLIPGETVTLEYNPGAGEASPLLRVSEVAYAYRGVGQEGLKTGFGSAGPCEVNVNCSEGLPWGVQKRGVTRIAVKRGGSTVWCTGSLVNNTRNDGTPYLLTADHCGRYSSAVDMNQWIFYFNYEHPGCPNTQVEPAHLSMLGGRLLAHGGENGSDFFLMLLNEQVPGNYQAYLNGWSRENISSPSGIGIHHPAGDVKKVSTYTQPLVTSSWSGYSHPSHWRVVWSGTTNGHGVTEGGSSGSPIFDNNGLLVGTLTGGDSMCDSTFLNLPDYYGKFSYHWDQNGTDSAEVLKYWLDPDSTGQLTLAGRVVGMDETSKNGTLMLWPNPAAESINMTIPAGVGSCKVMVYNLTGRVVLNSSTQQSESENHFTIDVKGLESGLYLIRVAGDNWETKGKFLKR